MKISDTQYLGYKPCIITYLGPVGVGKSTQMRLHSEYFKKKNIGNVRTYIKTNHLFTYLILRFLEFLHQTEEVKYNEGFNQNIIRKELKKKLLPLLNRSELVSTSLKFFFTVYVPFKLGFTVLIEEGLLMGLANYEIILPDLYQDTPRYFTFFHTLHRWCNNQNHIYVILDASDTELKSRRLTREFRRKETEEFVYLQRSTFRKVNSEHIVQINTSGKTIPMIHKEIVTRVNDKLYRKNVVK